MARVLTPDDVAATPPGRLGPDVLLGVVVQTAPFILAGYSDRVVEVVLPHAVCVGNVVLVACADAVLDTDDARPVICCSEDAEMVICEWAGAFAFRTPAGGAVRLNAPTQQLIENLFRHWYWAWVSRQTFPTALPPALVRDIAERREVVPSLFGYVVSHTRCGPMLSLKVFFGYDPDFLAQLSAPRRSPAASPPSSAPATPASRRSSPGTSRSPPPGRSTSS